MLAHLGEVISRARRTPYLLRLWVYYQDSVCKFSVTSLLNIIERFDGWVGGKERKETQARMTN